MINIDEKPMECKVRETVLRMLERAMHYNSTSTNQTDTGNKPSFYVRFYGHVALLEVEIDVDGFAVGCESEKHTVYLTEHKYGCTSDKIQNRLVAILKRMEEVYSAWYEKEHAKNEEEYK